MRLPPRSRARCLSPAAHDGRQGCHAACCATRWPGALQDVRLAPMLSKLLSALAAGRQHHVLLEKLLALVSDALERHRPYIRQKVHENSPRWLPKTIDDKFCERLMAEACKRRWPTSKPRTANGACVSRRRPRN
ncbi:hypothetical protein LP420_40850 [Massilia sp. B-10]|nr:hypothetical protein LP420_40850 [Massilia sp. B-10]